jgi:hypothetical protein
MACLEKGPEELLQILKTQAEFSNMPHIGIDANVVHPGFQLNATSAKEHGEHRGPGVIVELGTVGKSHLDGRDSTAVNSCLTNLSEEYPDVEEEHFCILDLGIAWIMEPLSTISFSGLHFHAGMQPRYKRIRADPKHIHYRLTLIGYSPDPMLCGSETLAFASLPNGLVLPLSYELKNPLV